MSIGFFHRRRSLINQALLCAFSFAFGGHKPVIFVPFCPVFRASAVTAGNPTATAFASLKESHSFTRTDLKGLTVHSLDLKRFDCILQGGRELLPGVFPAGQRFKDSLEMRPVSHFGFG